jgi:N-acetylglucosamine-6-phosphate deacetylase
MTSAAGGVVVRGGHVLTPAGMVEADVVVDGSVITAVGRGAAPGYDELDARGLLVAPGFIDVQLNGAGGVDLTSEPERLWEVAAALPRHGVTAFLPTIITSPADRARRALRTLAEGPPAGWSGATPLGLHVEGPMLNPCRKGAHPAQHLREPSAAVIDGWTRAAGVALVTLAPELEGAFDVVSALRAAGVVVAAGHTDATAEQMSVAADHGVAYVTHLFNAMAPFQHRAPGAAGAALADERLIVGLIADGIHVHPVAVAAAWHALGPERCNLVTDAIAALGQPDGVSRLGSIDVDIGPDGVRTAEGTLAGSNLSLGQAVRNLIAFTGCDVPDAIATVTTVPARLVGARTKGAVAPGRDADLTLVTERLEPATTIVGGRVAWRS